MKYLWMFLILLLLGGLIATAQTGEVTPEVTPEVSPEATTIVTDLLGLAIPPPMTITLPQDWSLLLRDNYIYYDVFISEANSNRIETVPIDVYGGPLSNGTTGWIVMVWGFDTLVFTGTNEQEYDTRSAWLDGLRMLQLVVFDPRCTLGTGPQRDYNVGTLPAVGTTFSAVNCPLEIPDTRGWFASLKVQGLNFAFFAYADPLQPTGSSFEFELQAILDTVTFHVEDITVSQAEFEATRNAFVQTQIAPTITPSPSAP